MQQRGAEAEKKQKMTEVGPCFWRCTYDEGKAISLRKGSIVIRNSIAQDELGKKGLEKKKSSRERIRQKYREDSYKTV